MYWVLIKASLFRKKIRTFLTIASISVAFLLFGLLNSMSAIFTGSMQGMSADIIMVMPKYNMFGTQPYSNVEYIRSLEGIEKVTHMTMMTSDPLGSMFDGMIFATDGNLFDVYTRFQATDRGPDTVNGAASGLRSYKSRGFKLQTL